MKHITITKLKSITAEELKIQSSKQIELGWWALLPPADPGTYSERKLVRI